MLTFPSNVKLYMGDRPVDFRRGIDGLGALVESQFGASAACGHVFIFLNKRRTQIRFLFWERDGFCLLTKRLEAGTFRRPSRGGEADSKFELEPAELVLLLEGIDVDAMKKRKRYVRPLARNARIDEEIVPKECVT